MKSASNSPVLPMLGGKPFAWVLHLEGIIPQAKARERQAWSKRIAELLPDIIA